ncbi:MAG: F0F1 ATP synthase subunit B [Bacteroidales bacterium]|jgi:F-type H+-transporting ATPase subunit b|nr:F0F1 ATP synthase subunit B [Bacteroidales bacterium]MDD3161657.1 F0F1 ATP synthase subunit B [Bacteroidales bacterium]
MSLLQPEAGLLFWMVLSFGVVFFILAKYAFPVILKMVEERKAYIDNSLKLADETNAQLELLKAEGEKIITKAREEQVTILNDALSLKEQIINEARNEAKAEAAKQLDTVRKQIRKEQADAILEVRSQVAVLAVDIAEKVIRMQLNDKEKHMSMINRLMDEGDKKTMIQ